MRSLELFAGCGGLALGLSRAGFADKIVIERDPEAIATLIQNSGRGVPHFAEWTVLDRDARRIDYRDLPTIDFLSGGPPCQPFSIGGKHLGPDDPRNMWPEAVRAVRELRPRAFVLENVRGLYRPAFKEYLDYITLQLSFPEVSPREGEFWEEHLARLRDHRRFGGPRSYRVLSRAVNAADYGAAQKRHRAIFIGVASNVGSEWAFPEATHSQEALAWSKHGDLSYWARHGRRRITAFGSAGEGHAFRRVVASGQPPSTLPWRTVRDAIADLPRPTRTERMPNHWQNPGARIYPNHTGSCVDEPAKALKAGDHGVPGGENMVVNQAGRVRYFTLREMARLQDLPDEFVVSGGWKAATRQLGNAVPASMAEFFGTFVRGLLPAQAGGSDQAAGPMPHEKQETVLAVP